MCVCVFFYYTPSAQASGVPCLLQTVGHDVCLAHSKTLSKTSSEVPEGRKERGKRETGVGCAPPKVVRDKAGTGLKGNDH